MPTTMMGTGVVWQMHIYGVGIQMTRVLRPGGRPAR
jgi:hypothetical protein